MFLTFFTLPSDWSNQVVGSTGSFVNDFMPLVLWLVGITIGILVIKMLAGIAHNK